MLWWLHTNPSKFDLGLNFFFFFSVPAAILDQSYCLILSLAVIGHSNSVDPVLLFLEKVDYVAVLSGFGLET